MMSRYNQRGLGLLICYVTPVAWGRGRVFPGVEARHTAKKKRMKTVPCKVLIMRTSAGDSDSDGDKDDDEDGDEVGAFQSADHEDIMEAIWWLELVREVAAGFFSKCFYRQRLDTEQPSPMNYHFPPRLCVHR